MRKLFVVAAAVATMVGAAGIASAVPSITLTPSASSVAVGDSVVLTIVLNNDVDLIANTFRVANTVEVLGIDATRTTPAPLAPTGGAVGTDGQDAGDFGGLAVTGFLAPGTYTLGTLTYQGDALGTATVTPYQRTGIDDWFDAGYNIILPTLNSASIEVIPEPATAALVGLGLVGLVVVGRRSRA